ncbi:MAG: hypothetical protein KJ833_01315, partial [Alphaproteobacteria bacterium]|nr:hypothetical protein [Alphaproteobacteria bacterium]
MSDERRLKEIRDVARLLDLDEEVSQDVSDVRTPCPLHADCIASGDNNLHLNLQTASYACVATGEAGRLGELIRQVEAGRSLVPVRTADDEAPPSEVMDASYSVAIRATNPVLRTEPQVTLLTEKLPSPEEIKAAREIRLEEIRAAQAERRRGAGEKLIVVGLALVFVIAGLMAAGLSGFANYQAFASTVADPAQGR